ncbi:MAG TPA: DNA primase [Pirellulales bacterium]|nr:DNA primase [Pirellulales bacterium]
MSIGLWSDAKEQVKRAIDIVDLVGESVPLRREGRAYKGLCPWHDDSRPSLHVNPERQTFRCFVCNIGGDIFTFIEKRENVTFREALGILAERAGVKLAHSTDTAPGEADQRRTLFQAMAWAEGQYHECFLRSPEAEAARDYVRSRGITDESVARFRLGFAPQQWDWLLKRARGTPFTPAILQTVGLLRSRQQGGGFYDWFRGRVLFSIRDLQGRPIALGGRVLPGAGDDEVAKYINSPETPLFSKSQTLYGLDLAKDAVSRGRTVMVMEGYTDCLIAQQCGLANAVAVLGTALNERHIRVLRRFADRVLLVLDGDEAGRRRADEILELFVSAQMDLRILTLPDDLDPADFLLAQGKEAFEGLLSGAVDALEHKLRMLTEGLDASSGLDTIHRAQEEMLRTLAKAPRPADRGACLREDQILSRLAHRFRVAELVLRERLADLRKRGASRVMSSSSSPGAAKVGPGLVAGPSNARSAGQKGRGNFGDADAAGHKGRDYRSEGSTAEQAALDAHTSGAEGSPARVPGKIEKAEQSLLEIMLGSPQLVAQVEMRHPPVRWRCARRRAVFAACCRLTAAGVEPCVERLLLEIDDGQLKTLIVESDELRQLRSPPDPLAELERLLEALRAEGEKQALLATLDSEQPRSEEEERDRLRRAIEKGRRRHGISAPMDG